MTTQSPLPIEVAAVCVGARWRLLVSGDLDLSTGRVLRDAADVLAEARVDRADLDLSGVSFVDSAGWRAVTDAMGTIAAHGGTSRLGATSPAVERIRRLTASSLLAAS